MILKLTQQLHQSRNNNLNFCKFRMNRALKKHLKVKISQKPKENLNSWPPKKLNRHQYLPNQKENRNQNFWIMKIRLKNRRKQIINKNQIIKNNQRKTQKINKSHNFWIIRIKKNSNHNKRLKHNQKRPAKHLNF